MNEAIVSPFLFGWQSHGSEDRQRPTAEEVGIAAGERTCASAPVKCQIVTHVNKIVFGAPL